MSREQRRAAIIEATLPLLRAHGQAVTTRQIAEASGIGEGTIFRVFADKAELVDCCLAAAFDQQPTLRLFAGVDRQLPLQPRLVAAVRILQDRLLAVIELLTALGHAGPPDRRPGPPARNAAEADHRFGPDELLAAFAELLEPDRDQLRLSPLETARVARMLTFAGSHPAITDTQRLSAEQIVSVLLYGVSRAAAPPDDDGLRSPEEVPGC